MKTCTMCKTEKEEDQFRFRNKKKNTRSCWCKVCFSKHEREKWKNSKERRESNYKHNRERQMRNAKFIWEYLSKHPCAKCGNENPIVLQFDHIDPSQKEHNVSNMIRSSYSISKIKKEISKCNVLCANCHFIKTAKQEGWYKYIEDK